MSTETTALPIGIESTAIRVSVAPAFGGRVVSLLDRRSGRDWMAQGPESGNTGEDAVYSADEAVGWDECFPTVSPWDASDTPWRRRLRDHGDLWGRPWTIESSSTSELVTRFSGVGFEFTRRLVVAGATLTADYRIESSGPETLPFMWALHGLLAVHPGEEIRLPGVNDVAVTALSLDSRRLDFAQLPWPGASTALPFPLDRVQSVDSRFAGKLYAPNVHAASVGGQGGWLDLAWEGVDHLGIWLNYGGWPTPGSVHHIALEPTTAPVDHLGEAIASESAAVLAPRAGISWRVSLTLRAGNS